MEYGSKIILQPSGNKDARKHYVDTVNNLVPLDRISPFLKNSEIEILQSKYEDSAPVWGVTPGKKLVNGNKWNRIQYGDVGLFAMEKHIVASGVITYKVHNKDLALDLWGTDNKGETWEYIYFLDEIKKHKIPYETFNKSAGYALNNNIQSFNVLDVEKRSNILNDFNLSSSIHINEPSEIEFHNTVENMDELSGKHMTLTRKEQGKWRKMLFPLGKRKEMCGICNKEYMVNMLVCAHIKKRSKCSIDEQKDFNNIAPMCKFGCDDLFEKGYITVVNGKIVINTKESTDPMLNYLSSIDGNDCRYWIKDKSEKYFKWHHKYHN